MDDDATTALLDAALEQFSLVGVRRTSADDIARRAGVNRATLYRRLGTMDEIAAAAMLHEAQRVLVDITTRIGDVPAPGEDPSFDPVEYVVHFFSVTLEAVLDNRLLQQLLLVERDETLHALTMKAADTLALSAELVADRVRALRLWRGHQPDESRPDDVAALSITLARLTQSFVLTPEAPPSLRTTQQRREYAELIIVPMILRD